MSIKADCHLHSSFSGDSQAPMPEMIDKGLALGLETMCFTEHNDFDYPRTEEGPGTIFLLNTDSYLYDVLRWDIWTISSVWLPPRTRTIPMTNIRMPLIRSWSF